MVKRLYLALEHLMQTILRSFLAQKSVGSGGGIRGVCLTLGVRVLYCKNTNVLRKV